MSWHASTFQKMNSTDNQFEALLDDLQIDDAVRIKMRTLDPSVKTAMIKGRQDHPILQSMTKRSPKKNKAALKRKSTSDSLTTVSPSYYVIWLQSTPYEKIDLEQMKKLRVLLRNESLSWITEFFSAGGYKAIWKKLETLLDLEWREEQHDDRLLYELLRCLKGLGTTEIGRDHLLSNMNVFERLAGLLFSEKQPGELAARCVIVELLILLINIHPQSSADGFHLLRSFLVPKKDIAIVDFVAQAHKPRIYKKWVTEMSRVANDHFWIFVHAENGFVDYREQDKEWVTRPRAPEPMTGGVEFEAIGYLTMHMILLNAYLGSCPSKLERLDLYDDLAESGFDRMLLIMRRSSQRYYPQIHFEMAQFLANARDDGWPVDYIVNAPRGRSKKPQADHSYQHHQPAVPTKPVQPSQVPKATPPPRSTQQGLPMESSYGTGLGIQF